MLVLNKQRGLTLIEAMVTVAIIGILSGIAWPLYQSQSQKNRRTEAVNNLTQIQALLERCYADNGGYDCCQPVIDNYLTPPAPEPSRVENYNVNFTTTNVDGAMFACKQAQGYTLTATPIAGLAQENDEHCQLFEVTHLGARRAEDKNTNDRAACWTD